MTSALRLRFDRLETPVGPFTLVVDEAGNLRAAGFLTRHERTEKQLAGYVARTGATLEPAADPDGLTTALARYFGGDVAAIAGLPVALEGTAFQRAVWDALLHIPCGETWSYAQLARFIGRPSAVRAVGLANGANPVALVVPCHRVIGSDGSLTGYGAGIDRKRWLLAHEGAAPAELFSRSPAHAV